MTLPFGVCRLYFLFIFWAFVFSQLNVSAQNFPEYYKGWPIKGFPLIIHKKKNLPVFPTIQEAEAFEKKTAGSTLSPAKLKKAVEEMGGKMIENIPGDFVQIADSYIRFIEPVPIKADNSFSFNCNDQTKSFSVTKDSFFYLYYQDPYTLIVGDQTNYCLIDLLYNIRPVPFSLKKKPKTEWWIKIYEYNSFSSGWIKFDNRSFFRNFNPRYLKNFNNFSGLTGDYEKAVIFKYDTENLINGLYWDAADFDAIKGEFKTHCLFIFRGVPNKENPEYYDISTLNINPKFVNQFQIVNGKLRYGWRGETSSIVFQLDSNPADCDINEGITLKPKTYPETKKTFPLGIGILVENDLFLRAVDFQELTSKTLFRNYYALNSERAGDIVAYTSPEEYILDITDDTFAAQDLKKWEQVFVYEVRNGWARINVRRIEASGWVPVENVIFGTQKNKFPPLEQLRKYTEESN